MASNKYYSDELAYLRDLGREFALAHPQAAPFLADSLVARGAPGLWPYVRAQTRAFFGYME